MLQIERLGARYGGLEALRGVSMTVDENELVSIIGANGAGKTTLLKAVSGTVPATGSIQLDGEELSGVAAFRRMRRGIIHVPQGRHVFATMTVQENLSVAGTYRGDREARDIVFDLFPALFSRRAQLAGTLSGGQQQMLAIGRGIMSEPRLLMLDEPSTGLAPTLVDDIFAAILRMRELRPMGIVLVEQRATTALEISSRCYVLEQGRVVLAGRSDELRTDDRVRQAYLGL